MTTPWYDAEMRGRRMETIFKDCFTKYNNTTDEELRDKYFHRMQIIEKVIAPYADQMTGVNKFLKEAEKKNNASKIYVP